MVKKITAIMLLVLAGHIFMAQSAKGSTLLSKPAALKKMFPNADTIITMKVTLNDTELKDLSKRVYGKKMMSSMTKKRMVKKGEKNLRHEKPLESPLLFYKGMKKGKELGVATVTEEPGKWGMIKFIVMLGPKGMVKDLAVMAFHERRGRPIVRRNFLKQFVNADIESSLIVKKDIRGVSGATISSTAAAKAVKKAIILYDYSFLKKSAGR